MTIAQAIRAVVKERERAIKSAIKNCKRHEWEENPYMHVNLRYSRCFRWMCLKCGAKSDNKRKII